MRGSRSNCSRECRRTGSIPASAGQPPGTGPQSTAAPVYPRECGAAVKSDGMNTPVPGLSPRVRGSPRPSTGPRRNGRSIPASAGQPSQDIQNNAEISVYPRECGAARSHWCPRPWSCGLSPRARGSPARTATVSSVPRSIPASAGQPALCLDLPCHPAVYPRECGAAVTRSG